MELPMINTNYHTHTYRCKHGEGDIADYCRAAIDNGIKVIAFTDHTPNPDNWHSDVRMSLDELDGYCANIDQARIDFPELTIIKGLECEYRAEVLDFYRDTLIGEYGIEMLVGAVHFVPYNGGSTGLLGKPLPVEALEAYTQIAIDTINSKLFSFFAHPDVFASAYRCWDENAISASRKILSAAQEANTVLEINGYGVLKGKIKTPDGLRWRYPLENFWKLASEYDIEVVVNSDAHYPEKITGGMQECLEIVDKYGLKLADMQSRLA